MFFNKAFTDCIAIKRYLVYLNKLNVKNTMILPAFLFFATTRASKADNKNVFQTLETEYNIATRKVQALYQELNHAKIRVRCVEDIIKALEQSIRLCKRNLIGINPKVQYKAYNEIDSERQKYVSSLKLETIVKENRQKECDKLENDLKEAKTDSLKKLKKINDAINAHTTK